MIGKKGKFILVLLCALLLPLSLSSATLLFNWNANIESDLTGYRLHYGTAPRSYTSSMTVGKVTSCQLPNVPGGRTYYAALTAFDANGNESPYSPEVSVSVPLPPGNPTVTLQSPARGAVVSSPPTFVWSGTGIATYSLYASLRNRNYTRLYTGTGTSHTLTPSFWRVLVPSGSTIFWYVTGVAPNGQVVTSTLSTFRKR